MKNQMNLNVKEKIFVIIRNKKTNIHIKSYIQMSRYPLKQYKIEQNRSNNDQVVGRTKNNVSKVVYSWIIIRLLFIFQI